MSRARPRQNASAYVRTRCRPLSRHPEKGSRVRRARTRNPRPTNPASGRGPAAGVGGGAAQKVPRTASRGEHQEDDPRVKDDPEVGALLRRPPRPRGRQRDERGGLRERCPADAGGLGGRGRIWDSARRPQAPGDIIGWLGWCPGSGSSAVGGRAPGPGSRIARTIDEPAARRWHAGQRPVDGLPVPVPCRLTSVSFAKPRDTAARRCTAGGRRSAPAARSPRSRPPRSATVDDVGLLDL